MVLWLIIMIPCSGLLTGLGIMAWRRKKPMWFWSGSTVKEEISDIRAYNRANGIMWITFSHLYWACTIIGIWNLKAAGLIMLIGSAVAAPLLIVAYRRIYRRYRVKEAVR